MSSSVLQLEIPVLLPEVEDEHDQCVERLRERLGTTRGISEAHVVRKDGQALLCLHYDPDAGDLAKVERLARDAGAQVSRRYRHENLWVKGMDCADCVASIEHILSGLEGIVTVSVSYAAERLRVEYDAEQTSHEQIVRRVRSIGYSVEEARPEGRLRRHRELVLALAAGAFLAAGFFGATFLGLPREAELVLYGLAYLAGGFDAARHGLAAAARGRLDIDFLMVVAALGAAAVGELAEGALLLFLFSLGHALEHYAIGRARAAIQALGQLSPKSARVRRDGQERELPVEKVIRGDLVVVRPGERVPVDGQVAAGSSAIDQSPISGESVPVEKSEGDGVFAGTVNGQGALEIEVTKLARDTTLQRVITLVEEAQTQKSPTQRFTDRFTRVFVPVVLSVVVLAAVVPSLAGWLPWQDAFLRSMAVLVAASPCALGIGTPAAVLSGVARGARRGVLIKGGAHLENLGRVAAIALDKTGTLTHGRPEVTDIVAASDTTQEALLRTAAAVESRSAHPLAQAVVRRAQELGLELPQAGELRSLTGRGVEATLGGETVRIGSLRLFEGDGHIPNEILSQVERLQAAGRTTMLVRADDRFLGVIGLADTPREQAKHALDELRALGINDLVMLTGDNEQVAAAIAKQIGLREYRAGLLPEQKVSAVKDLLAERGTVAMVGDGVNDAPALAQSTVGIAMGAGGSDAALETADIALMADDLAKLPFAVGLSRKAGRIIRQNLIVSLAVVALLVPAALAGAATIAIAVALHEGSTLAVVANALRLLGYRGREPWLATPRP